MNQANSTGEQTNVKFSDTMYVIIGCILVVFAITGNVFVIIAHLKDPLKLFQTSSSQFILNIAVVDLFAATSTAIFLLYKIVTHKIFPYTKKFLFFPISLSFPSFFILSVERFCSVAFPLWHRVNVTLRSCRMCLLGIWIFHSTYEAGNLAIVEYTADNEFTSGCIRVTYVLFFFISTQAFYLATCLSLKKQNHQIIARQDQNKNSSTRNNPTATRAIQLRLLNEKQFLITIAIVCLILALTVLPSIIYYKVIKFIWPEILDVNFSGGILISLLRINFTVNPLIYLWRLRNYRKTLKVFLKYQG